MFLFHAPKFGSSDRSITVFVTTNFEWPEKIVVTLNIFIQKNNTVKSYI